MNFLLMKQIFSGCGKYKGKGIGYGISGIFVKYLIDQYGMEKFKNYCMQNNHLSSVEIVFNKPPVEFINDFKIWIKQQ